MRLFLLIVVSLFATPIFTQNEFITTWQTTTANESITIPTNGSGYNYDIDWNGDNVFDDLGITGNATHTYPTAGVHTVKIRGDFPRIFFNLSGDRNKILSVEQWGNISWTSFNSAFLGCANLVVNAIDAPDLSNVTDLTIAFGLASSFNQSINHWDVSTITNMDRLFASATSFNQSLTSWDVSNVNQMTNTFAGASSFNQPLDSWNVSGVTTMRNMFFQASAFNQTLISWDVSAVTDMNAMFRSATAFDRNIGNWDISALTNVGSMFVNAGLSTGNYDSLLTGWSTLDAGETQIPANLNFHAGNSSYCAGATARNILTSSPYNWTITDAGLACIAPEITISLNAGKLSIIDTGVPNNEDLVLTTNNGKLTIQSSVAGLEVINIPSAEYQGNDRVIIPLSVITDGLFIDGTDKEEGSVTLNIDHNFTTGDVEVINTTYIDQTGNLQTTTGIISLRSKGGTIIEGDLQTTTGKITLHGNYEFFNFLPIYGDLTAYADASNLNRYGREGVYISPTASVATVSGSIEMYGTATRLNTTPDVATRHGIHIAGSISSTGTGIVGIVDLQGLGQARGQGSTGVFIKNATINVVDATLTVWGIGGHSGNVVFLTSGNSFNDIAPNHREGIFIDTATISSTGQGDLNFTGTSGPQIMFPVVPSAVERQFGSDAIEVRGATLISVIDSDVNMTGAISDYVDDPALTAYGAGINLPDTAKIYANGTGNINLTGTGQQTDNPLTVPLILGTNVSYSSGIYMNSLSTSPTELRAVDGTITINNYDAKHGWLFLEHFYSALGGIIETVGTGDIIINAFAGGIDPTTVPASSFFNQVLTLGDRPAGTISTVDGDIIINGIGKDGVPARLSLARNRDFRITGSGNFITSADSRNLPSSISNIFLNTGDINLKSDILFTSCLTLSSYTGAFNFSSYTAGASIGIGSGSVGDVIFNNDNICYASGGSSLNIGESTTGNIDIRGFTRDVPMVIKGKNMTLGGFSTVNGSLTLQPEAGFYIQESNTAMVVTTSNLILEGELSPGNVDTQGTFTVAGDVTFSTNSSYTVDLVNAGSTLDQLILQGTAPTLTLNDAPLQVGTTLYTPVVNEETVIIDVAGTNAVVGTFNGLAEGDTVIVGGETFTISYVGGDGNDVSLTNQSTLGVLDNDLEGLRLYPNPATKQIIIKNNSNLNLQTVLFYDLMGRLVKTVDTTQSNTLTIDISNLESATYFIKISADEGSVIKKLIKN